jgi:hypothetical protein
MAVKQAFGVWNGMAPDEGPKALSVLVDFSSIARQNIDLLLENTTAQLQYVQSLYCDNTRNPNPIVIVVKVTQQRIVIPGGGGQILALFSPDQTQIEISSTVLNGAVTQLIFLNVPLAPASWSSGAYGSFGPLPVGIDRSGTIASGGVAQQLAPANPNRLTLTGQNISANPLGFSETGAAPVIGNAGTFTVAPGASFAIATNQAIFIVGGTTAQAWTATET